LLMPVDRALAATTQAHQPIPQRGARPGLFGQLLKRQTPFRIGPAVLVEIQQEKHQSLDLKPLIQLHIHQSRLGIGIVRQRHHAVENGLKLAITHLSAHAMILHKEHSFIDRAGMGTRHSFLKPTYKSWMENRLKNSSISLESMIQA